MKLSLGICAAILMFMSISAYAEEIGPGVTELNELHAAQQAVIDALKSIDDLTKASAPKADIDKAKNILTIKKALLAAVQEQVRPVLSGIVTGLPAKDTPISKDKCYMRRPLFGDLSFLGSAMSNWSVGTSVSTQLIRYNFSSKKTSLNTNAGAGISFRYYGNSPLGDDQEIKRLGFSEKGKEEKLEYDQDGNTYTLPVYKIKPDCRATTSDFGKERKDKLAGSIFSISPTLYASKQENSQDVSVQPAILLGFLDDIINIGTGFNLSGPETGKMFLVFSLGYGFQF